MELYEQLLKRREQLAVIGLGYVGMPLAVAFSNKNIKVIGFDLNQEKIELYKQGKDPTNEVGDAVITDCNVDFTCDERRLREAKFHIIAVPTPIKSDKTPELLPVESASRVVGRNLTRGSVVVYESTVYPGVTEDICVPILEQESGLKCGTDFKIGYSPERINPGDRVNTLEKIVKIVSGMDAVSLEMIARVYEIIIDAGVYRAESIKVAEAAKVVENSQRDINIAFMNELAIVFDRMEINTVDVINAMNTKWNALRFYPGLVGGHCIGVDPYYFIYEAEKLGYSSQIITSGRKINDDMGRFVGAAIVKKLVLTGKVVRDSKVYILGLTFKENCPDIRNSKVKNVYDHLCEYGIRPLVVDPWASKQETVNEYGIELIDFTAIEDADCLVFAVAHDEFKKMNLDKLDSLFKTHLANNEKIIIDIKSILDRKQLLDRGYCYWNL